MTILKGFSAIAFLVFILSPTTLISQGKTYSGKELRDKAEKFFPDEIDSAIFYISQALKRFEADGDQFHFIDAQQYLASYLYYNEDYTSADSLIKLNWELSKQFLSPTIDKEKETYGFSAANRALLYLEEENFNNCIELYEEVLPLLESIDTLDKEDLAFFYNIHGISYRRIGDPAEALRLYQKTEKLYAQIEELDPKEFPNLYFNMGRAYLTQNESNKALDYLRKADSFLKRPGISLEVIQKLNIHIVRGKAMAFLKLSRLDSAYHYAIQASDLNHNIQANQRPLTYAITGTICVEQGKFEEGSQYLKMSQKENPYTSDKFSHDTEHRVQMGYSRLAQKQARYRESIHHFYKALQLSSQEIFSGLPKSDDIVYKYRTVQAIEQILPSYLSLEGTDSLPKTLALIHLGVQLIDELRESFDALDTKLDLAELSHSLLESGLATAEKLQTSEFNSSGLSILQEVFSFMESSKSILLFEALQGREANFGLPPNLRKKERRYKRDLAYYQKAIFDNKEKIEHRDKEEKLHSDLFATQQQYKYFIDTLERTYSTYVKQKYHWELVNLVQTQQQLSPEEVFIQYFVGDSNIYVLGIHQEKSVIEKIPLSDTLLFAIEAYSNALVSLEALESVQKAEEYRENAYYLYKVLLAPVLQNLPKGFQSIIISSDGILSYLPFEALLSSPSSPKEKFSELPYLLNSYALSYTHSATHWFEQNKEVQKQPDRRWIGFAPTYEESQITQEVDQLTLNRFLTRDGSVQLPYANEEIEQISQIVGGKGLFAKAALESDFQNHATKYQVLHLATHGLTNDTDPMYSKLVFAPEADSSYDGYLHAYEIYNMQIPADLVVLSACNTGVGKLEKGEGIMSLSRAFFYAGVKSLVMSLWKVSDESTSELMVYFYEGLKAGLPKDQALQQAKINYLANQDIALKSHPYFWAGFVLKGNAKSLDLDTGRNQRLWIYLGLALLVISGLILAKFLVKARD